jgi:hypothetical protein
MHAINVQIFHQEKSFQDLLHRVSFRNAKYGEMSVFRAQRQDAGAGGSSSPTLRPHFLLLSDRFRSSRPVGYAIDP